MDYSELQPSPRLAVYIKRFWSLDYESAGDRSDQETVLPDGCPEIVFNLSERFERLHSSGARELQPSTLFAGQMSRSITIRPTGGVRLFGVRFHPAGAFLLGRFPMHELTDHIVGLDCAIGREATELEAKIAEANSFEGRVAEFERYFIGKVAARVSVDRVSAIAAARIERTSGAVQISGLSRELGVTERGLERRFRSYVGVSPKMLARIVRFQGVLRLIQGRDEANLLDAVHELGYFDQAHMIHDFREFSGDTPTGYFRKTHNISDVFTAS